MRTRDPGENLDALTYEAVLAQLRHAYQQLLAEGGRWDAAQRQAFADGLIGPQIRKLERLHAAFNQQEDDAIESFAANARWRRRFREAQEKLLSHASDIASASQARRIIMSVFHDVEKAP